MGEVLVRYQNVRESEECGDDDETGWPLAFV
ncbi:hypothetical protein CCACVL1_06224 [Corchorus capsularis]|uniref:Uncharacterized protein n=1 Tax=Corchorus capsularis TaxID=210143 RepID=A0A1R3JGT7_COCAP|nr:hypothetical protein CCACVL1_06224 [Corchorus capsularis]